MAKRAYARSRLWPDPVGEVIDGGRGWPTGWTLRRVRVPLGVIAVVYEARPNVTIDAAALCLKSGNAIVLRGSSHGRTLQRGARGGGDRAGGRVTTGLPAGALGSLAGEWRSRRARGAGHPGPEYVDLIIPRGGEGLKAGAQTRVATVPVIYAASG